MAIVYTEGKVILTLPERGEVVIQWSDPTQPDSPVLELTHKVPPASETVGWTREDFMREFSAAVANAEDIPVWAYDEEIQYARDVLQGKRRAARRT